MPHLLHLFPHNPIYLQDLHSFPTRRSSDLTPGREPASSASTSPAPATRRASSAETCSSCSAAPASTRPRTWPRPSPEDRKSTRLNSSHPSISYAVFCLKKKI